MLDDLNELKTLQQVVLQGSLTRAARALSVSVPVVSKRLASLERRAGVRLVNRTTHALAATEEGVGLLAEIDRALEAIKQGEALLATGREEAVGTLRVSAPVSFGRRHVAPVLGELAQHHPGLTISLSLDDRLVDVAAGVVDVAIRIGNESVDRSAAMRTLMENIRIAVASPAYLDRRGRPATPDDLTGHDLLRFGNAIVPWRLTSDQGAVHVMPARAKMLVDNGDALQDWCVAGYGIMLKSIVDVADGLRLGSLERVLPSWNAGYRPIVALFPSRTSMPRKTRVFLDAMGRYAASIALDR